MELTRTQRWSVALIAVVAAVTVKGIARAARAPRSAPILQDYGQAPEFSLVDQDGRPLSLAHLRGQPWIADFIFTRCAGQCPMMHERMAALQAALADVRAVRLVSFSVDPDYDTPERLAAAAARYGAEAGRWAWVTGPPEAVARLARQGFHLAAGEGGGSDESLAHSVRLVLVDAAGHIRGYYDAGDRQGMRRLERDARALLAHGTHS